MCLWQCNFLKVWGGGRKFTWEGQCSFSPPKYSPVFYICMYVLLHIVIARVVYVHMHPLTGRQGTHRDDFTLLAERMKKLERSNRNPSEESIFTNSIQAPRSSLSNIFTSVLSAPMGIQVPPTTRHSVGSIVG